MNVHVVALTTLLKTSERNIGTEMYPVAYLILFDLYKVRMSLTSLTSLLVTGEINIWNCSVWVCRPFVWKLRTEVICSFAITLIWLSNEVVFNPLWIATYPFKTTLLFAKLYLNYVCIDFNYFDALKQLHLTANLRLSYTCMSFLVKPFRFI